MARKRTVTISPVHIFTSDVCFSPSSSLLSPDMLSNLRPLGTATLERGTSLALRKPGTLPVSPWLRWVVQPRSSFKVLMVPIVLYLNWELVSPALTRYLGHDYIPNPFAPVFLLHHRVPTSSPDDPRYQKGWFDLVFICYYVVFFSLFRQLITVNLCRPIAKYFGLRKEQKLDRFGEQGYAVVYFSLTFAWGCRIMSQLPTWWYRTEAFWIDYPHWDMKPELKRYYLMQMAYWLHQLLVLILGLERPRRDYMALVAHHIVTIWLVGWSYLINLTLIGNAVFMSMDIPDAFLGFSRILNYLRLERAKFVSFGIFLFVWTYFRHILNFYILWSVWFEYDLIPETSRVWVWENGTYLNWWMKYQVFVPLVLLQLLNLFWYYLILRILVRALTTSEAEDVPSDEEDGGEDNEPETKEKDD